MSSADSHYADQAPHAALSGSSQRSLGDWAAVLAFGAIQWPWLLKSLLGGGSAARIALLHKLDFSDDALPPLGSWRADAGFLDLIATHIGEQTPETVVEFGGGASTIVAARALQLAGTGRLFSFDSDIRFVTETAERLARLSLAGDVRLAPLTASAAWPGCWYDPELLPPSIDLLVIDGPPWALHPFTRGGADAVFDRISPGGVVMLDDAARLGERVVARRWRRDWPDFDFRFVPGIKGTLIGRRAG